MNFLSCIVYLALIGAGSFLLGRILPAGWFHEGSFPFAPWKWEHSGSIYQALGIRKWQNRVPDMSKLFPFLMQEKKVGINFKEDLPLMIKETCIAEFIHVLLCFAGLYCIRLMPGLWGVIIAILNILGNFPFIIIQRYNRPRLMKLQAKMAGSRR